MESSVSDSSLLLESLLESLDDLSRLLFFGIVWLNALATCAAVLFMVGQYAGYRLSELMRFAPSLALFISSESKLPER